MILVLRGQDDFWRSVIAAAEAALAGASSVMEGGSGKSEDEIALRFIASDGEGAAMLVYVLPDGMVPSDMSVIDGYQAYVDEH